MSKIRVIKKNDEINTEYEIGDVFDTTGTWYGGVHISGRTGVPVSLDKDEYVVLETEKDSSALASETSSEVEAESKSVSDLDIRAGDIVQHFKRERVSASTSEYLYQIMAFATHTETEEKLVVYQALYAPFKIYARPYDMFMGKVDRMKYPDIRQTYRFEKVDDFS